MPFLPAVSANLGYGHAVYPDFKQGCLYILQFVRLNDRFDFYHGVRISAFQVVTFFTVHAEIQPLGFILAVYPHSED